MCYGRLDVVVEAEAIASAAKLVRQQISSPVLQQSPIYTSPLSRCTAFAQAIANPRAAIIADELVEMDFGAWEGRSWDTLSRDELDRWAQDIWCFRPGGGENARAVAERWKLWLTRLQHSGEESAIGVTHAGMIRVVLAQTERVAQADLAQLSVEFSSVHHFEIPDLSVAPQ
jgi:alpha-ribazole phosphatase